MMYHLFSLPPSRLAVFWKRLSGPCGHCWRFGLQEKIENLDVEEEAGNMVVDEVGPFMYNGLFIGRGGTISWKDPKCGDFLRRKRGALAGETIWTQVTLTLTLTLALTLALALTPNP